MRRCSTLFPSEINLGKSGTLGSSIIMGNSRQSLTHSTMKSYRFLLVSDLYQGLGQLPWPTYEIGETDAVTEETPPHFRIAVGGVVRFTKLNVEVGANSPIVSQ